MQLKANSKRFYNEILRQESAGLHLMRIEKLPQSLNTLGFWKKAFPAKTVHLIKGFHRQEWSFFPLLPRMITAFQRLKQNLQKQLIQDFVPYQAHKPIFESVFQEKPYLRLDDILKESGELHF
jgi:hypothetical protein